jgi:hypothetical protein
MLVAHPDLVVNCIYLLGFTLSGCLVALNICLNRLRKGRSDFLFEQILFFVSGAISICLIVTLFLVTLKK